MGHGFHPCVLRSRVVRWAVAPVPLGLLLVWCFALPLVAAVSVPPVLSNHMVLQRGQAVPIWGTAAAGEHLSVAFRDQRHDTTAGADGRWLIRLTPLSAGGPDVLTITGTTTVTLSDVLVGEVWLGAGQSNMVARVKNFAARDPVLARLQARAPFARIRLMNAGSPGWQPADAGSVAWASAILLTFGADLEQQLDVPVGLMTAAVAGTPSGFWLSGQALADDADCQAAITRAASGYDHAAAVERYQRALTTWEQTKAAAKPGARLPKPPDPPLRPGECRDDVGHLYEQHVRPLVPFAIRGVVWDQGESGSAIAGVEQDLTMGALIRGWRRAWASELPFICIQKPSGGGCAWDPADPVTRLADAFAPLPAKVPDDGAYRGMHLGIGRFARTHLVQTSDLGGNTHPDNKSGYGLRAARVALGAVYGQAVATSGPTYRAQRPAGRTVVIAYDHLGKGLAWRHGERLQGFAIAGQDRRFVWADARIDGDTVIVSSPQVSAPAAVRYAWAAMIPWANLFNQDGLPAVPFRTDDW